MPSASEAGPGKSRPHARPALNPGLALPAARRPDEAAWPKSQSRGRENEGGAGGHTVRGGGRDSYRHRATPPPHPRRRPRSDPPPVAPPRRQPTWLFPPAPPFSFRQTRPDDATPERVPQRLPPHSRRPRAGGGSDAFPRLLPHSESTPQGAASPPPSPV